MPRDPKTILFYELKSQISQIEAKIKTSDDYDVLLSEIKGLQGAVKSADIETGGKGNLLQWLSYLFCLTKENELSSLNSMVTEVEKLINELNQNPLSKLNVQNIREKCNKIKTLTGRYRNTAPYTEYFQKAEQLQSSLAKIQKIRNEHFTKIYNDFRDRLSEITQKINDLSSEQPHEQFNKLSEELKSLFQDSKGLSRKKQEQIKPLIDTLFDTLKEKESEIIKAEFATQSGRIKQEYLGKLDELEERLENVNKEPELESIRSTLMNDYRKPLSEKTSDGKYKIKLIRDHRNELFEKMRGILIQIDEKREDIKQYHDFCQSNKSNMEQNIESLTAELQELIDNYNDTSASLTKGDALSQLGNILNKIRKYHQDLKSEQFFPKDKYELADGLNNLWSMTQQQIDSIARPKWSEEWLSSIISKNRENGGVFLSLLDDIPRP